MHPDFKSLTCWRGLGIFLPCPTIASGFPRKAEKKLTEECAALLRLKLGIILSQNNEAILGSKLKTCIKGRYQANAEICLGIIPVIP